jgi:hypothetical protein
MKHYINTDGWFMGSFQNLKYVNPAWIEVSNPSNNDFKRPKWDFENEIFIEAATPEELQTIQKQKKHEIYLNIFQVVNDLTTSALARATNKQGAGLNRVELENLKQEYKDIYIVAKNYIESAVISDSLIFETLEFEQINDFAGDKLNQVANQLQILTAENSRIEIYCKIIIKKYELGELMLKSFSSFIRTFRSKMITFLDQNQFEKVEAGFEIVASINNDTTNEQIIEKFNEFNML